MTEKQSHTGVRRYRTRDEARQLAAAFQSSGLSRQEFCALNNVSVNTLSRYLKKHGEAPADDARLIQVEIAEPVTGMAELAVVLSGGRRVEVRRGFDTLTLRQLVAALERF